MLLSSGRMPSPVPLSSDHVAVRPDGRHPALFRFGLRNLLLSMGGLSVLFAAMSAFGGMLALALLLLALVVAAHVLSTFVGTRLRDGSTAASAWEAANGRRSPEPYLAVNTPHLKRGANEQETVRHLHGRGFFVRWVVCAVAMCGLAASAVCAVLLFDFLGPKAGVAAIVAAAVAAGVLAAWAAFLALGFYIILRRAWREAVEAAGGLPLAPNQQTAPAKTAADRA